MARPRKNAPKPNTQELSLVPMEEQPYPLPEGWKWVYLNELTSYPITDGTHQTPTYSTPDEGIPFISAKDVTSGYIDWSKIKYITPELHEKLYSRIAPIRGDILLAKNGTTGICALVETDLVFDIYVTLALIRPNTQLTHNKFLYYVINSPVCKEQFSQHLTGIGVPNLHLRDIKSTYIPLPPLNEQERIVTRIESLFAKLDEAKEKAEAVLDSYATRKAAILHKAFTGELTAKWREEKGIDLSTWQIKAFSDIIFETKLGLVRSKSEQSLEFPNTYLKMNNISSDGQISLEDITKVHATNEEITSFRVLNGDFLFNTRNSYELVGKSAVFKQQSDEIVLFNNNIMRIRFNKNVDSQYVSYFFLSTRGKKQLDSFKKNTTNIAAIYAKNLNDMQIPVAFLDEQKQIARILDNLLEKEQQSKAAAEAVLEQIDLMKKAILAKAFRGELG